MLKVRFYHLKTLFWSYAAWAVLNLLFAFIIICKVKEPLLQVPFIWLLLQIAPIWLLFLGEGACVVVLSIIGLIISLSFIFLGILIEKKWASSLILLGMSIWFCLPHIL